MTRTPQRAAEHPHTKILRVIYQDLTRLVDYAAHDIVLHPADRTTEDPRVRRGIRAVRAHEHALIRMTEHTLVMDVEHIVANDHFGTVLGVLRAQRPRELSVPFCGLWRFADGRIAEHWENTACGPDELRRLFTPPPTPRPLADAG
ncbi:nuclear transport factor 2 family protein [Streptomyces sp. SID8361]|uniref:nuclear transport factor 2 family protein n=1 Tax=Streptomyces sp. MnatMP-M27 TaxID=1839768 RepID=UPI00081DF0C4|nr:nuclear transport factor 2 family protein [Streptomyces sp. MnatMP-M27]MYU11075.1 nuclear transport factor 2 family protein [Streptomyces sp. SID8361]SCF78042.1 SnoaL-like domain-containing protein [Streptomyces sp. MnatMP-M27]